VRKKGGEGFGAPSREASEGHTRHSDVEGNYPGGGGVVVSIDLPWKKERGRSRRKGL